MSEVIVTKMRLIERPRLLKLVAGMEDRKATIITAPAGYGKTVFLLQAAKSLVKPVVWYQLDSYDNDPAILYDGLIDALRQYFLEFDSEIPSFLRKDGPMVPPRFMAKNIINTMAKKIPGGLVIFFDDYHVITESTVHTFFQEMLAGIPDGFHMMIAGRIPPPFNLPLHLSGGVLTVTARDLAFDTRETKAFLGKNKIPPSKTLLENLERKTAGWPMLLHLLAGCSLNENPILPDEERNKIYRYLANEVFNQQPEKIRQFLTVTSILETLTPEFCNLLRESNDSEEILSFLAQQQIFLTPLTGGEKNYRYNELFREFLQDRLGREAKILYRRAGEIAHRLGRLNNAVEYYLKAEAFSEAAVLIKETSPPSSPFRAVAYSRPPAETIAG